jgi:hypothetical protein
MSIGALKTVQQALPICEAIDPSSLNWTKFDKIMKIVEHPKFYKIIFDKIFLNDKAITTDV